MTTAVTVPAEAILAFLRERGFTQRTSQHRAQRGTEIVYERSHDADPRYKVLVYTSVREGSRVARSVGKDAIRVCAIFEDGTASRGVCKLPRVHRTGTVEGVLARVLERMRAAYARCSEARPRVRRVAEQPSPPQAHARARCAPPIDIEQLSPAAQEAVRRLSRHFDAVQQKHHPGSMPHGHERRFGERFPEDDLGGDEP